jgi:hypothetical protein
MGLALDETLIQDHNVASTMLMVHLEWTVDSGEPATGWVVAGRIQHAAHVVPIMQGEYISCVMLLPWRWSIHCMELSRNAFLTVGEHSTLVGCSRRS